MSRPTAKLVFTETMTASPGVFQYEDDLRFEQYPRTWHAENVGSGVIGLHLPEQNSLMVQGDAIGLLLWHKRVSIAACLEYSFAHRRDILTAAENFLSLAVSLNRLPRRNSQITIVVPSNIDSEDYKLLDHGLPREEYIPAITSEMRRFLERNRFLDIRSYEVRDKEDCNVIVECLDGEVYEVENTTECLTLENLREEGCTLTRIQPSQVKK